MLNICVGLGTLKVCIKLLLLSAAWHRALVGPIGLSDLQIIKNSAGIKPTRCKVLLKNWQHFKISSLDCLQLKN